MYYQSQIYNEMGFTKFLSTIVLPVVNNLVNFISTFPGMWGIEKFGRKTLLIVGAIMMMIFHILTWTFSTQTLKGELWKYLSVISVFLYVFALASIGDQLHGFINLKFSHFVLELKDQLLVRCLTSSIIAFVGEVQKSLLFANC